MTSKIFTIIALTSGLLLARASELSEKGRAVFNQHQHEVVTVQVVQRITSSARGSASEPRESRQDLTGTVVDPSGLTVLALSAADPSEFYKRLNPESSGYRFDVEISDLKILLEDGTEMPAEIVLRDKDLDLAFIRPKTKPAKPMPAVDLSQSTKAQTLDELITLNRLGRAAGRAHAASVEFVSAVVQRPRTFYIPDSRMTGTALGSPAFALDGRIVGIIVMRAISAGDTGMGGARRDNATSIILPAEDIAKAAKQAPEAGAAAEKKEEKKEEPKEQK